MRCPIVCIYAPPYWHTQRERKRKKEKEKEKERDRI